MSDIDEFLRTVLRGVFGIVIVVLVFGALSGAAPGGALSGAWSTLEQLTTTALKLAAPGVAAAAVVVYLMYRSEF